jgi:hypothetical protein
MAEKEDPKHSKIEFKIELPDLESDESRLHYAEIFGGGNQLQFVISKTFTILIQMKREYDDINIKHGNELDFEICMKMIRYLMEHPENISKFKRALKLTLERGSHVYGDMKEIGEKFLQFLDEYLIPKEIVKSKDKPSKAYERLIDFLYESGQYPQDKIMDYLMKKGYIMDYLMKKDYIMDYLMKKDYIMDYLMKKDYTGFMKSYVKNDYKGLMETYVKRLKEKSENEFQRYKNKYKHKYMVEPHPPYFY